MKRLKLFFACLLMAVLSIGQMWAADSGLSASDGVFIIDFYDSDKLTTTTGSNLTSSNYSPFVKVYSGLSVSNVVTAVSVTGTVQYGKNGGLTLGTSSNTSPDNHIVTFTIGSDYAVNKVTVYATKYDNGRWKLNGELPDEGTIPDKQTPFDQVTDPLIWDNLNGATSLQFKRESTSGGNCKRMTIYTIVCEYSTGDNQTCATPTFSPAAGVYSAAQNVAISCETADATIYYTTNGNAPTTTSDVYTSPIAVSSAMTIKAMAVKSNYTNSSIATAKYGITAHAGTEVDPYSVADAKIVIDAIGTKSDAYVTGTISQVDSYSDQYKSITYWISTDGTTTDQFEVYGGKGLNGADFAKKEDLSVGDQVVVKGNLKKFNSTYEFDANSQIISIVKATPTACATPTFTPAEGEYTEAQNVTISCATDGATIYYTTDGTEPSTSSNEYTSAIAVSETTTIQAIAVKDGLDNSAIASATYTITTGGNPTVTFNYADYKGEGTSSSGSEYTMVKTDIVSIGGTKFYGNNSYAHFYANGTITITPATGYTITKIVLTASGEGYNGYQSSGVITASTGTMSHDGVTVIWEGSADAEFTLGNDKQIRWTSIVVTYEAPDPNAPVLTVAPNVIDFGEIEQGETVTAKKVAVNFANLTGDVTYSVSSPFSAAGTISTTGDEITISANTETVGEYSETLTVTSAADSKSATVTVTMNVTPAETGEQFIKVTATPAENDWTGDYLLVYESGTTAYVWDGTDDAEKCKTATIKSGNKIIKPEGAAVVSIEAITGGHSLQISGGTNDGKYIVDNANNAALKFGAEAYAATITYETDWTKILFSQRCIRYNAASGQDRFRYYADNGQQAVQLYKAVNSKVPAGLAYTATSVEKVVGTAKFINAITNDNNLTIAYASNNPEVATVDAATGEVTIVAAGIAEITASTEGDETHKAGSAKYTICVTAHAGSETDPYTVADAKIVIDALGTKPNVYASGIISQVDAIDLTENFYATYWISADGLTEGQQLEAYHGKYLDNANFSAEDDIKVGDAVVIYGNLKKYNSTYEFDAANYLISLDRTKVAAGLAYTVASVDKEVGDAKFTNELTNPNNVTVAYSSSDASVASVDAATGEVTVNAMGSATITATFAGNGSYLAGSASYTVNVSDPNITKVTFDATVDMTTGSEVLTLTKNGVTMEISKGQMHNGTSYRLNKDNTLTLSCADGLITRIELEGTDPSYAVTNITATNYSNGVWTGSAESVDLVASVAQARMTKINVYYGADSRAEAGLAWNPATDIELTVGDAFTAPELKNPNNIDAAEISIESSNTAVATVTAGVVELVENATGEATITASFAGNATYKSASVSYKITVNAVILPPTGTTYHKVTATADITDGEYLIVYEGDATHDAYAFNGSLDNVDQAMKGVAVTINEGVIAGTTEIDAAVFTINVTAGTLLSASGLYIGRKTYDNGMDKSTTEAYVNTFAIAEGEAVITGVGGCTLRYNYASDQLRFRYYKSGQQAIQLYKKDVVTPPAPTADYTRPVEINRYGTICLPNGGTIEGAKLYDLEYFDEGASTLFLLEVNGNAMVAGRPYVFLPSATTIEVTYTDDANETEGGSFHGLIGSLASDNVLIIPNAGNYILYENAYYLVNSTAYVGANRAYIHMADVPTQPSTPGPAPRRRVGMTVHGEQTATGVDALNASETPVKMIIDGQMYILRGEKLYDATGRLVK